MLENRSLFSLTVHLSQDIINDGSADSGGGEEIGISNGSAAASSDGLEIDPGIAQRLFQFQHTGDGDIFSTGCHNETNLTHWEGV